MTGFSEKAFADWGRAAVLSAALGLSLVFMPLLAILAAPLIPVPVTWLAVKRGPATAFLAALAAGAICFLLGPPAGALIAFLLAAIVGIGAGVALRRGIPQSMLLLLETALFLAAQLIWGAAVLAATRMGPVEAVRSATDQALKISSKVPSLLTAGDSIVQLRAFFNQLPYLLPSLLLLASLAFSAMSMFAARRVFVRLKQPFPGDFCFRDLRLHFSLAYVMIAGLVCYLASPYLAGSIATPLRLTGLNFLIISEALFFVQALAITIFFLARLKVSRAKQAIVYICLVVLQLVLSLPSWLGLFDIWIDYRRRYDKRVKKST